MDEDKQNLISEINKLRSLCKKLRKENHRLRKELTLLSDDDVFDEFEDDEEEDIFLKEEFRESVRDLINVDERLNYLVFADEELSELSDINLTMTLEEFEKLRKTPENEKNFKTIKEQYSQWVDNIEQRELLEDQRHHVLDRIKELEEELEDADDWFAY